MSVHAKSALAIRIGRHVRFARLHAGMTQQEVAGRRYTKAYVSAIENGLVVPSLPALEYIAAQLNRTTSSLVADDANSEGML